MLVTALFSYMPVKRIHGISYDDEDSDDDASEETPLLQHYYRKEAKLSSGE